MQVESSTTTESLFVRAGWSDVVQAMATPAAIVDAEGVVIAVNQLVAAKPGDQLIAGPHPMAKGLRYGTKEQAQWRLRPLSQDGTAFLALTEDDVASIDELTALANRDRLVAEIEHSFGAGESVSMLLCDLDRFKAIVDSVGNLAGDELLRNIARRLTAAVGGSGRLVARFGGPRFAVLLPDTSLDAAEAIAVTAHSVVDHALNVDNRQLPLAMNIGVSRVDSPDDPADGVDRLLRRSDVALSHARTSEHPIAVFNDEMQQKLNRRATIEAGLRPALVRNEVGAFYQPVIEVGSNTRVGYEALLRWHHGNELLSAGAFIDVAIDSGLMPKVASVVWSGAFALAAELRRRGSGEWVSVNVSPQELAAPDFVERFARHLSEAGAAPEQVIIEITESAVLNDDGGHQVLEQLRGLGVRVGLDNFGAGYTSLTHLRDVPIDLVKIARSFTADINSNDRTRAMTASVIHLCHALGLAVVVEGVETATQEAAVAAAGGRYAQGWHYDSALPAQAILG